MAFGSVSMVLNHTIKLWESSVKLSYSPCRIYRGVKCRSILSIGQNQQSSQSIQRISNSLHQWSSHWVIWLWVSKVFADKISLKIKAFTLPVSLFTLDPVPYSSHQGGGVNPLSLHGLFKIKYCHLIQLALNIFSLYTHDQKIFFKQFRINWYPQLPSMPTGLHPPPVKGGSSRTSNNSVAVLSLEQ